MILKDLLKNVEGRKVRIGAHSAFLYFGVVDKKMFEDLEKLDPGCLDKEILDMYHSFLENDELIIIYDSDAHGRFWFESEFKKAIREGRLFDKKEVHIGVKRPKKLTYIQKRNLMNNGYNPEDYRFYMEDDGEEGFVKVINDSSSGKLKYDDSEIVWIRK